MGWPFRRGRTITVTRATINPRTREKSAPEVAATLTQCAYDPGSTAATDDGSQVTQAPRFFGPYDADVLPDDEISIAGIDGVFYVDGEVLRWHNDLTGTQPCCEVKLTRKRGQV